MPMICSSGEVRATRQRLKHKGVTDPDSKEVLITGVYGSGKTSVVDELADILESPSLPYAALDLDWPAWTGPGVGGSAVDGR